MEKNNLKSREEMDSMYKWQIEKIYASIADWENDFNKLKEIVPNITKYEGKLHIGQNLLSYFKLYEEILRLGEKLAVFAHCRSDEDTTNTTFQSLKSKIDTFFPVILANTSFFIPEILSIPKNELLEEIQKVEELKIYTFLIEDILNLKPHTLSKEEENIMASVSECLESPGNIYSMLSNADITFPKIKDENDEEIELTDKNYSVYISSKDRRVREIALKPYLIPIINIKNTFAIFSYLFYKKLYI